VRHILDVSARAPSGHNVQPWRVYALAGSARDRLCEDILQAARTDAQAHQPEYEYYPTEWHEPYIGRRRKIGFDLYASLGIAREDTASREAQMLRNYSFFDAPVGLLVTLDRRLETGSYMDLGMFIQNILIAARGQGLHTCAQAAFAWYHARHVDHARRGRPGEVTAQDTPHRLPHAHRWHAADGTRRRRRCRPRAGDRRAPAACGAGRAWRRAGRRRHDLRHALKTWPPCPAC
jgi:nitroreductase